MITNPPEEPPIPSGTTIVLEGTNGPPTRCVVTCGAITNEHAVGTGPGALPLSSSRPGAWAFPLSLPNATGECVVFVFTQNDKSEGRTYTLISRPDRLPAPPG